MQLKSGDVIIIAIIIIIIEYYIFIAEHQSYLSK